MRKDIYVVYCVTSGKRIKNHDGKVLMSKSCAYRIRTDCPFDSEIQKLVPVRTRS